MNHRAKIIDCFLEDAGWGQSIKSPVAGDASNRNYLRLTKASGECAILMDAPPDRNASVDPFVKIAQHLRSIGLSAPTVFDQDVKSGLLLLEDLGDRVFASTLAKHPQFETEFYEVAIDVLVRLFNTDAPVDLEEMNPKALAKMTEVTFDWYVEDENSKCEKADFFPLFDNILSNILGSTAGLTLRDFHAENLIWMPGRQGVARAGLIDFQDALVGHPAYDLVSLLQDARRDVPPHLERKMVSRFIDLTGQDSQDFQAAYCALGAQRNLRIIGIFARLCIHSGRPDYITLIPRVWTYLIRDLQHPSLTSARDLLLNSLTEPTPEYLKNLRRQCIQSPIL